MMISIEDYVKSNRPAAVTDMLLRQLPDAIALWREEEPLPRGGRLVKESIMVDADTGIVTIKAGAGGMASPDADDVKDYGNIVAGLLAQLPYVNRKVSQLVEQCKQGQFDSMGDVMLAVEKRKSNAIYIPLVAVIVLLVALLAWLNA